MIFIEALTEFLWGGIWEGDQIIPIGPISCLLVGAGIYMMYKLSFMPVRRLFPAFKEAWDGRKSQSSQGLITPWQSLSTALAGQVGTGNLAGVATAIALGGPGAIFWMWIAAIFGMALAFSESSLAIKFRRIDGRGRLIGGPMEYIDNGLGKKWRWLAIAFAVGTIFSAIITGAVIQANSLVLASSLSFKASFDITLNPIYIGVGLCALVFIVIIGGIKSIGKVAGKLIPTMTLLYIIAAIAMVIINYERIPFAFELIFSSAFGIDEATGGLSGYAIASAIRAGVARGLFSNEAGQGTAAIAHAAAQTKSPKTQGEIAMIGVFIDTIIVCTLTALVILTATGDFKANPAREIAQSCVSELALNTSDIDNFDEMFPDPLISNNVYISQSNKYAAHSFLLTCQDHITKRSATVSKIDTTGFEPDLVLGDIQGYLQDLPFLWEGSSSASAVTALAFDSSVEHGAWIVTITLLLFTFTTIIGWSYYGEQASVYLFGHQAATPFRYLWIISVFIGCVWMNSDAIWLLGDLGNATMVIPNVIAIVCLLKVVQKLSRES